jgi:DNA-binding transcriptional regulator YdaS (Cro superfamily)
MTAAVVLKVIDGVVKFFGPVVVVAAIIIAFYEGVPGLRDIPGISYVPVIRDFVVGRVQAQRALASEAAVEGYVSRTELKAAQAEAARLKKQADDNARFAADAHKQAAVARLERDRALSQTEKDSAEETDPNISRWRQPDLDRLSERRAGRAH